MTETYFEPGAIVTYTGRVVKPMEMTIDDISLVDISHALSQLCRFTGHTKKFYSVAEHSVRCYDIATEHKLWVLLHDASETYLNDIARPLKHSPAYEAYREAEEHIMRVIAKKFELPWPEPAYVKSLDRQLLATEVRDLMWGDAYTGGIEALSDKIIPLDPETAETAFIYRLKMEGLELVESHLDIEAFMKQLEDDYWDQDDEDWDEEDTSGGAPARRPTPDPKPHFGDALPEPEEDDEDDENEWPVLRKEVLELAGV